MAAVAANLYVSWTAVYVGQHRVCWTISPSVIYDCTSVIYCGGGACSLNIPITVDNESCDPVTYNGYVQPSCDDPSSEVGRVPFTITFTPIPTCVSYSVACISTLVGSLNVTTPGKGYDPFNPPVINITGGGGAGATATATVGNSYELNNEGSLYTPGVYTNVNLTTNGIGTGALATVTVNGGGFITSVVITDTGTGYYPADLWGIDNTTGGMGGIGLGCEGSFGGNYGVISGSILTNPGDNYTSVPIVSIDPSPLGIDAVLVAVLDYCPSQILGDNCAGGNALTIDHMSLGQSAIECMQTLPSINSHYIFTPSGCCYDCHSINFNNTGGDFVTVYYTDCITHLMTNTTISSGNDITLCVVNNSWYFDPSDGSIMVSDNGSCP